ncbi:MAG: glycoside hydrolase family 3 C-terminal domain-containing protein, partial [Clostridia bacterium]|nr:glycoside hydrolase family 3 C-terminal domain-containing protein [Clostridia bacterium]
MTFLERAKALVAQMTLEEKMSQMKYNAPAIPHLGVPAYNWWNECLHGVARSGVATVFPQAIGMAASFDTDMMYRVATAISDEARAKHNEFKKFGYTDIYQGLTYWSPNINIFRDPRWGRGHETYGEDPYLTGRMGVSFIKGLQGEGKYRKLDATIKHLAAHSGPEELRHGFDTKVSEKDLRETYLWAFKYCIDHADPSAVMGAYNRLNGEPCCASKTLLKDILYGEWGFDGYVVSDCGAICDIHRHHKVTNTDAESAALAVNNGCQLNCGSAYQWLKDAYDQGLVSEEVITASVEKLFEARYRLGMFDDDCEYDHIPYDVVDCDEHRALNRQMAQKCMVLLKNDGILPLDHSVRTIAVIGPNADEQSVLLGNYNGTPARYSTLLRGIQDGFDGRVIYARGCHVTKPVQDKDGEHPRNEALIAASKADVVIMIMGINPTIEGEEG